MVDEIKLVTPAPKPKSITLRAFEIKNLNISKATSEAKSMLLKKLESVKISKDRCMQLSPDDPNKERDLISYYKSSDVNDSLFCTMLRISTANDVQHVTETLFEKETFTMDDIATAYIDTSAICKGFYYFSLNDNFVVTNLPLNKTVMRLQTYLGWFIGDERFELTPMISPKEKTKLSDLKGIVMKDPEPLAASNDNYLENIQSSSSSSVSTESKKTVPLKKQVWDVIKNSLSDTQTLDEITLSQMISAELVIKFKKPRKMTDEEYKRVLGAYLKPVSDLDNVVFKRADKKTEVKGKDLLKTKNVSVETTESGKIVEQQLLKQMSDFLIELNDEKNRTK